jgi:hypothetical protein
LRDLRPLPRSVPARQGGGLWLLMNLGLVACETETVPPEVPVVPAPARIEPVVLLPWELPELQVDELGAEPRSPLRVSPAGARTLRFEAEAEISGNAGSQAVVGQKLNSRRSLRVEPAGDSTGLWSFVVEDYVDTGAPPEQAQAVAAAMMGRRGSFVRDGRCAVSQAGIDVEGAGPAAGHLDTVLRGVVELCPYLPEEALGVGATWTSRNRRNAGGLSSLEETRYRLLERGPGRVVLTFELQETAEGQIPAGKMRRTNLGEGRIELVDGQAFPLRADAHGRSVRESWAPVADPAGPPSLRTETLWRSTVTAGD